MGLPPPAPPGQVLGEAVVLVAIGSIDLVVYFNSPSAYPPLPTYTQSLVDHYTSFIKALHALGARRLLLLGLGPMGCLPLFRTSMASPGPPLRCNASVNAAARSFNRALAKALLPLQLRLGVKCGARFANFDLYEALTPILQAPPDFGFQDTYACCGGPPPLNAAVLCGNSRVIGGRTINATVCPERDRSIFWDFVHYTQHLAQTLAQYIAQGNYTSQPASLGSLIK